jgi:hypothetical protein
MVICYKVKGILFMCKKLSLTILLSISILLSSVSMPYFTINASASALEKIKEATEEAGNTAKEKANEAAEATKKAAEKAGSAAKQTMDDAGKAAKDVSEKAGAASKEAATKAKEGAEKTGEVISDGAGKAYNSASNAASKAGNSIKNYIANIDTAKFEAGWDYAAQYTGTAIAALKGQSYVNSVQNNITSLQKNMVDTVRTNRGIAQEAGFAAEVWATDTFNIDAALNNSDYNATRPSSNKANSADVVISDGKNTSDYSLKYYKDADSSANAQARTFFEDYREYCSKTERNGGTPMSDEEYLAQYGKSLDSLYDSLYSGQGRIIPTDQLDKAKTYLKKRNAKMTASDSLDRQALSPALQETIDNLADRIEAPDGTKSRQLSESEAKAIVELCRDGDFDPADFGISPSQLITTRYILKQSINAGAQSAMISTAFAIGPDIYEIIVDAAKNGKVDEEKLKETGIDGILAGSEGFVEGSVSSAIVVAAQSGKFGTSLVNIAPETVGTLTVLTIDAIRYGYQLSSGKITKTEYADLMTQDIIIALASQTTGALMLALFPFIPFSYMAGSMAGAMLASVGYQAGKELYLELRGEDGFETIVPSSIASGTDMASAFLSSLNIKDSISGFKDRTVTAYNNGKIKITSRTG